MQQNQMTSQAKHTSRLWLLIIFIVIAVLLALLVSATNNDDMQSPGADTQEVAAPALEDDTASIQAELESLQFEGVSEGI